ncbi:MAG: DUF4395 domain-containing protein [Chloroflexi bacterium]|nr:DUF4395 domain-containing protein [Chloroflexota bacterium]
MTMRSIDQSALRVNQASIISFLILGFITDLVPIVAFVAVVMLAGTLFPPASLFKRIYQHILKPAGIVKPDLRPDNPEPHRFAQGLGGFVTLASAVALVSELTIVGWALAWLVIALAALNLFAGFCLGCFVYYQLSKRNVPGFTKEPVTQ